MARTGTENILSVSLRRRMTPDELPGRMNATFRSVLTGALAAGAALPGLLGEMAGVRVTLWAGAVGASPVLLSPLRVPVAPGVAHVTVSLRNARGCNPGPAEPV
ncbi:hypothetical protein [Streptomyces sp. NPDC005017]|uniref:hypothetical protein n=1 Tax=Streptomyces sp. NPDC005017 TaxID=3364706 RepID=UPI00369E0BC4